MDINNNTVPQNGVSFTPLSQPVQGSLNIIESYILDDTVHKMLCNNSGNDLIRFDYNIFLEPNENTIDYKGTQTTFILSDKYFDYGNNGEPLEWDPFLERWVLQREPGHDDKRGGGRGEGTSKKLVYKIGLPWYMLNHIDGKYYIYEYNYTGLPDDFSELDRHKAKCEIFKKEITIEEYAKKCHCVVDLNGSIQSEFFQSLPNFFVRVKKSKDWYGVKCDKYDFDIDKAMDRVSEQLMLNPTSKASVYLNYPNDVTDHHQTRPGYWGVKIKNGKNTQYGTTDFHQLPVIKDRFKFETSNYTSWWELRAYLNITPAVDYLSNQQLEKTIGQYNGFAVRGHVDSAKYRLRHGRIQIINHINTTHGIWDVGGKHHNIVFVAKHLSGEVIYGNVKSHAINDELRDRIFEVYDEYLNTYTGNDKVISLTGDEDRDTITLVDDYIFPPANVNVAEKMSIRSNLIYSSNGEITKNELTDKKCVHTVKNKIDKRQIDLHFTDESRKKNKLIVEVWKDKKFDHIDRLISWAQGKISLGECNNFLGLTINKTRLSKDDINYMKERLSDIPKGRNIDITNIIDLTGDPDEYEKRVIRFNSETVKK